MSGAFGGSALLRVLTLAALSCAVAACTVTQSAPKLAEGVTHDSLRASIHTICVFPIATDSEMMAQPHQDSLRRHLVEVLKTGGFATVLADFEDADWKALVEEIGGLYDPHTGAAKDEERERISSRFREMLAQRHGCEGFLTASTQVVNVPWQNATAYWDGAELRIPGGELGNYGYVPGLSLWVTLEDTQGKELYFGTGGISVAMRVEKSGWLSSKYEMADLNTLLSDEIRNAYAADLAVSTLVGASKQP